MTTRGPKLKITPFEPHGERLDLGRRWEKWTERFQRELLYNGINKQEKAETAQMALLIYAGNEVEDIHDSLPDPVKPEGVTDVQWTEYAKSLHKLNAYFVPQKSNDFAIFELMNIKPEEGEATHNYASRLRKAAAKCDFSQWSADKMIKCLIITNMGDEELRLNCLQKDYTLDEVMSKARKKEDAQVMSKKIDSDEVNKIRERKRFPDHSRNKKQDTSRRWEGRPTSSSYPTGSKSKNVSEAAKTDKLCRNCGGEKHANFREECPAVGRTCNYCKRQGHFAKVCLSKMVNQVSEMKCTTTTSRESDTDDSGDEADYVDKIEEVNSVHGNRVPLLNIKTQGYDVVWQPDTGASRDIWSAKHVKQYERDTGTKVQLQPSKVQLFAYGQDKPLRLKGQFEAKVGAGEKSVCTQIIVTDNDSRYPLLSEETARELGVVSYDQRYMVKSIVEDDKRRKREQEALQAAISNARPEVRDIIKKYPKVFSGKIGCAPKTVKIMIDGDKQPIAQRGRKIPYNLEAKSESKLQQLLSADVIERVPDTEPRTWVSPPVVAPKPGSDDIRFCVDMREANRSIMRPNAQLPTTDDVIDKLRGATVFSKLDLREAYHQFQLDDESKHVTTFHGPEALYRYKRLNYGTKSAQDILQNEMSKILAGIPNQMNVSDDVLIGGSTETHDAALEKVLAALDRNNITVAPAKCLFDRDQLSFLGIVFGKDGVQPDESKIKALKEAGKPANKEELRSFLGMAGFSQRFIAQYAQITAPLREAMTTKRWKWGAEQEKAFTQLCGALTNDKVLRPYQIGASTQVTVDASPTGLGAVLTQKQKGEWVPVAYKSRSLKGAESRYSQTEREALGVRWGVKKLRKYLLGAPQFKIVTDHRPLCPMFNKNKQDLPPRIERFVMDVQGYDYEVVYQPGKSNIADYLSRHPLPRKGSSRAAEVDEHVQLLTKSTFIGAPSEFDAVTSENVRESTRQCDEMKALIEAIHSGDFTNEMVKPYRATEIREALYVSNGIVHRGDRIVVPAELRRRIIKSSHVGHQGLSKTKQLVREFCWFPGIDRMVEEMVRKCIPCLAVNQENSPPPIKPHELPRGPWQFLEMDLQGPYPTGEYLFVMIDRYSKWAEIAALKHAPNAKEMKKAMMHIFDDKGIPFTCQADNGPPFQSEELKRFARREGFTLKHITPEWPRANGEVERFNRTLKAAAQKGTMEGKSLKESIQPFVRRYRATPHSTTGVSPYEAMFGRKMKVELPLVPTDSEVVDRGRVEQKQQKMMEQGGRTHKLSVGDSVLVKQPKQNKLTPNYNPKPAEVVDVKGSMVSARINNRVITRDGSRFKLLQSDEGTLNHNETSSRDDIDIRDAGAGYIRTDGDEDSEDEGDLDDDLLTGQIADASGSQEEVTQSSSTQSSRPRRNTAGVPPVRFRDYEMYE